MATNSDPVAASRSDSDGAALFSMDDLRARLDAPLFHRDQGLTAPAQLPRLREISWDHAVPSGEVPVVDESAEVAHDEMPSGAAPVVEPPVVELPVVELPVVELTAGTPAADPSGRPKLMSLGDMIASSAAQPAAPTAARPSATVDALPQRSQPEPVIRELPTLGASETQALLAVLATFEASANTLHELNSNSSAAPEVIATPEVIAMPDEVVTPDEVVLPKAVIPPVVEPPVVEPQPTSTEQLPATAAHGRSSIEAELNRLAFLPDQEEPAGPVVIPTISRIEQRELTSVPILSQHEMYNPRATPSMPPSKRVFEAAFEATNSPRRRSRRGFVRRLFSVVIPLALLGGGLYAAKYYLLDKKWDSEVKPLVADVEAARGLEFNHAVEVSTLTADEYATRIANYALGVNDENADQVTGELRALGLLSGVLDLRVIGLAALPETPAFYDAGSEKIYVVAGLPAETYRFAMHRALATALVDQEFGWGGRIRDASPSVIRGTRALYEADGLATALSILTAEDRMLILEQRAGLFTTYAILASPSQFGTAVAGRLGLSLRSFVESIGLNERNSVLRNVAINDAQAMDLRRLVTGVADGVNLQQQVLRVEVGPARTHSQGTLFWYHVLASRLDSATAWNNALAIQFDDMVNTAGASGYCVGAVLTVTPSALDAVTAAFAAWAAFGPAASSATVVPSLVDDVARIALNACDPGVAVATNNGLTPLTLGGAPLRSEQYRLLLAMQPGLPRAQAACSVYGGDNVSISDERLVVDPVEGWLAPASHPTPDPGRADCVAA